MNHVPTEHLFATSPAKIKDTADSDRFALSVKTEGYQGGKEHMVLIYVGHHLMKRIFLGNPNGGKGEKEGYRENI